MHPKQLTLALVRAAKHCTLRTGTVTGISTDTRGQVTGESCSTCTLLQQMFPAASPMDAPMYRACHKLGLDGGPTASRGSSGDLHCWLVLTTCPYPSPSTAHLQPHTGPSPEPGSA